MTKNDLDWYYIKSCAEVHKYEITKNELEHLMEIAVDDTPLKALVDSAIPSELNGFVIVSIGSEYDTEILWENLYKEWKKTMRDAEKNRLQHDEIVSIKRHNPSIIVPSILSNRNRVS